LQAKDLFAIQVWIYDRERHSGPIRCHGRGNVEFWQYSCVAIARELKCTGITLDRQYLCACMVLEHIENMVRRRPNQGGSLRLQQAVQGVYSLREIRHGNAAGVTHQHVQHPRGIERIAHCARRFHIVRYVAHWEPRPDGYLVMPRAPFVYNNVDFFTPRGMAVDCINRAGHRGVNPGGLRQERVSVGGFILVGRWRMRVGVKRQQVDLFHLLAQCRHQPEVPIGAVVTADNQFRIRLRLSHVETKTPNFVCILFR